MEHLSRFNQFVILESKWSSSLKEEQIIDLKLSKFPSF